MNLLNVVRTDSFGPRKGSIPLIVEFRVNPDTAPFLVSSSRAFVWVTPKGDRIRTAIRLADEGGLDGVFREIITTIADTGATGRWDNVHPYSPEGLTAARAHLAYYDLKDVDVVAHPDTDTGPLRLAGGAVVRAPWVPAGWVVVLPTDREFVGFVVSSGDRYLVLAHNTSRAVAVVRP